jgi:hypothetical protein
MSGTSIGFGSGEVIEVGLDLEETRELLEGALYERMFVELEDLGGESVIINPLQVKVLQRSSNG